MENCEWKGTSDDVPERSTKTPLPIKQIQEMVFIHVSGDLLGIHQKSYVHIRG